MPYQNVVFRGQPIDIDVSIALGYWGDLQIELINQHNADVASGYTDCDTVRREGLHHVLVKTDDVEKLHRQWLANGATDLMTGEVPGAGRFIYMDAGDGGPFVELAALEPRFEQLFDYMRAAAANWDGKDPVRPVPDEAEWDQHPAKSLGE